MIKPHISFEHPEDEQFFADFLCGGNRKMLHKNHHALFDSRSPTLKRKEFNTMRSRVFGELMKSRGLCCELALDEGCTNDKHLVVDHFIPISSNELNKKLRYMKALPGKKVVSQSFGANNINNFLLACQHCNNLKKHRFMLPKNAMVTRT